MEKKEYTVIGKVEIGTDEYRDLIEGLAAANAKYEESNSTRWREYSRAEESIKKAATLQAELDKLNGFINSNEEIKAKYRLHLVEQQIKANENKKS